LHAKRELYVRFGVQEYWIVDPEAKTVQGLGLSGGQYEQIAGGDDEGIHSRILPGLVLTLEQVFADV
jgi:Uma2 family endonuclease